MLETENLGKTYPTGDEALRDVSVTIGGREVVAMIGPSGAGKSTFVRCINRLVEPTTGSVRLDDRELTGLGEDELRNARRDIGMVFQEYNLVERLTVMENVLSGRLGYVSNWAALRRNFPPEDVERAYELLDLVGLDDMENKRVDELSGGQRQRVGIARAVVQEPKIVLADEPTSSLDPETSRDVMELLTDIAVERDVPVVINIHEVDLAERYADRILGLHDGELVFDGPAADLTDESKGVIYRGEELPASAATDPDRLSNGTGGEGTPEITGDGSNAGNGRLPAED
ncbi:Phosphonate ABC transporter ATP-binding protein (TC 3.A.1.9.1) [Halorubrum sp. DM2]|uniref:phosphonate ABC transporter ATP-binding protein n=1 Tax=unclassified Halorubrum TaxID=2642239 RepID=UPI0003DC9974|nr:MULTISPECIES: phosphonate ABC transporter ATP-binding protein [unclassified Halorubrum]CDK40540.1 phosphonate ABC transporter, ATP-binding protein [Halorubrum sp. AJ67]VTT86527.1 Phosphonate ABC transporter ATP-binding protein (TC 3.A.1.9.1) [Halorubrum sp. DM2]